MTTLVAGPKVLSVRTGIMSSSFQPSSGPLTQFVLPACWPWRTVLKVAAKAASGVSNQVTQSSTKTATGCFRCNNRLGFIILLAI